jgi:hypothetical protein
MRKLKLEVGELKVESFSITDSSGPDGTVHGRLKQDWGTLADCGGGGGATGPSNPVCIGPTYCCNPTANTTCCAPKTDTCPESAYINTCPYSCYREDCIL